MSTDDHNENKKYPLLFIKTDPHLAGHSQAPHTVKKEFIDIDDVQLLYKTDISVEENKCLIHGSISHVATSGSCEKMDCKTESNLYFKRKDSFTEEKEFLTESSSETEDISDYEELLVNEDYKMVANVKDDVFSNLSQNTLSENDQEFLSESDSHSKFQECAKFKEYPNVKDVMTFEILKRYAGKETLSYDSFHLQESKQMQNDESYTTSNEKSSENLTPLNRNKTYSER